MQTISIHLLRWYFSSIEIHFLYGRDASSIEKEFHDDAIRVGALASERGELDELRLAIDWHLSHDDELLERDYDLSLAEILQSENYQPESTLKDILAYYRSVIWPGAEPVPPDGPTDVVLVKVPLEDWRNERTSNPSPAR